MKTILITGGAGFIGSALVRKALEKYRVVVLDALTYAGFEGNLVGLSNSSNLVFVKGDISDQGLVDELLKKHNISAVLNLAAESHVDNSISGPLPFIDTNIRGTFFLLESARKYWTSLTGDEKEKFRFLHVSTDEVFGELGATGYFNEETPYHPNSPYSASKAASDHLVSAWNHTYKVPTLITNCSNNYGPRQFPEKLIPRMIDCALSGQNLPVYGNGSNVRDWIHVDDHAKGLLLALEKGRVGQSYCFGGRQERKNLEVVKSICKLLQKIVGGAKSYEEQIAFVEDRAGHDWRYAIDDKKSETELGFVRTYQNFEAGLEQTIHWYLENKSWIEAVKGKKK
jgi:dTDP-glucose 4,6-dehydratase